MEKNTPIVVSVKGWSGSGKTTFCEKLISELSGRGFRVSAAKNSHRAVESDKAGSDSHRFFNSGAESVCLNGEDSLTLFYHRTLENESDLTSFFPDADFIIAEGFSPPASIRVEVTGSAASAGEMKNPPSVADIIVFGNPDLPEALRSEPGKRKMPLFIYRDEVKKAADYLVNRASQDNTA